MDISKEIFMVDEDTRRSLANMCNAKSQITYNICKNYFFLIAGRSYEQWNNVILINKSTQKMIIQNLVKILYKNFPFSGVSFRVDAIQFQFRLNSKIIFTEAVH